MLSYSFTNVYTSEDKTKINNNKKNINALRFCFFRILLNKNAPNTLRLSTGFNGQTAQSVHPGLPDRSVVFVFLGSRNFAGAAIKNKNFIYVKKKEKRFEKTTLSESVGKREK